MTTTYRPTTTSRPLWRPVHRPDLQLTASPRRSASNVVKHGSTHIFSSRDGGTATMLNGTRIGPLFDDDL
eukprot:scaffold663393_cov69-Prasinocladus_malaysianus.AAC.1